MDFNELVDKAKVGFDAVCKKTEDVVNVSKLKIDKSGLEAKLSKSYEMLGQLCYDAIQNGEDMNGDSFKALIDDITENRESIKELDDRIQGYKSKKLCPKCHSTIDINSVYCSNCGEKVE